MHRTVFVLSVLVALTGVPGVGAGQQAPSGAVAGSATDQTGAAVADTALDLFGPARRATRTDAEGRFAIDGLPPGDYRLVAQRDGLATFDARFTLAPSERREVSIALAVADVAEYVETVSKVREEAAATRTSAA